jgi:hypothetical protein
VGVPVADGVGVGLAVGEDADGVGVGAAGAEVAAVGADVEGAGADDVDGDEADVAAAGWTPEAGWLAAGGSLTVGAGSAVPAALAVAEVPARAASGERGLCDPLSASAAMIPVEAMAIKMPAAAAIRDSRRIRCLGCLIGSGKPFGPNGPARSVTSCRYAMVWSLSSAHRLSTSSRSSGGSVASGIMPNNAAGRSAPRMRVSQTSH